MRCEGWGTDFHTGEGLSETLAFSVDMSLEAMHAVGKGKIKEGPCSLK